MVNALKSISLEDILSMDKRYRGTFINSLTGFKSVALVGSQDSSGLTNLAIFNSIVHLGAHPPLIGMIVRPDSVDRHTLQNIEETGVYTINHIQESMIQQAHQTSARYPKEVSEFDAVGLTPEYLTNFQAPFVKESNLKMAVQFKEKVSFTSNGTIFVIGEIQQVYLPETAIQSDGLVDLVQVGSITNVGLDSYHTVNRGVRLPYAKP
jgi:flavin reductase (DIM6/NTAB) family NADH-FMN oxidoreductase RutF